MKKPKLDLETNTLKSYSHVKEDTLPKMAKEIKMKVQRLKIWWMNQMRGHMARREKIWEGRQEWKLLSHSSVMQGQTQ